MKSRLISWDFFVILFKIDKLDIDSIKRLTLKALMSDDILMQGLVLKGGNALQLAYDLTNRGSIDIDFSIENEFSEKDFFRLENQFDYLLNTTFNEKGIKVYDIKFILKPKSGSIKEWKGYLLQFKLIKIDDFNRFKNDINAIRRNSIKVNDNNSTIYTVDISAYEYVESSSKKEIEGIILRVYTPEMILFEKIRALCQTMILYKNIVKSARQKKRARDIYDIYLITQSFTRLNLDPELLKNIFEAKKVPLNFLKNFEELREQNRDDWNSVLQTISTTEELKSYDFYFDKILKLIEPFKNL